MEAKPCCSTDLDGKFVEVTYYSKKRTVYWTHIHEEFTDLAEHCLYMVSEKPLWAAKGTLPQIMNSKSLWY